MDEWMGWGEAIKKKFVEMPSESILMAMGAVALVSIFFFLLFTTEIVRDYRTMRELEYKMKYATTPTEQVSEK